MAKNHYIAQLKGFSDTNQRHKKHFTVAKQTQVK